MKYIAFIGLGLVILATILYVVLWANMPTAKLAVYPVRPLGSNVTWLDDFGPEEPSPAWEFAITNAGRTPAHWVAYRHFKEGDNELAEVSPWHIDRPAGVLSPGESATIKVGEPLDPRSTWALTVKYWPDCSPLEMRLYSWFEPVPKLRRILPNDGDPFAVTEWYSGTNITIAH
jgi:hypothetical protein